MNTCVYRSCIHTQVNLLFLLLLAVLRVNHSLRNELFQERVRLISHWFDLWTDKQRKQFLHWILTNQKFFFRWLDFTTLLPRFISLYIFSFLNPKDLCAAAQVNWHWKFLTEQDCVWMPKCIKLGWFLPYTPEKNEYSAWKQYYIACAMNLDCLAPRKGQALLEKKSAWHLQEVFSH
uniref:Epithelial cell transforming 2 like n=1 Tax=Varanus komodoensis TaxID=61221 RepID=A0A8D2KWF0_VARKO